MANKSHGFAIGRIRVLESTFLSGERLERLLNAPLSDTMKVLQEIGFGSGDMSPSAYERIIESTVVEACALIKSVSPQSDITDCFLLKYDIQNLKALLKARCLGSPEEGITQAGIFGPGALSDMVRDQDYRKLPAALVEALNALEARLSMKVDPRDIDVSLDKAYFKNAKNASGYEPARRYFSDSADLGNMLMLLRAVSLKLDNTSFTQALLPGGSIELDAFARAFSSPERIATKLAEGRYKSKISALYARCISGTDTAPAYSAGLISAIEKAVDDYLLSIFKPLRYTQDTVGPLIGYLLGREREAAAIRAVMVGKINGFSTGAIRERVRDLYA